MSRAAAPSTRPPAVAGDAGPPPEISVLGPLELSAADRTPVPLGGARLRTLLALLTLTPGREVPAATLIAGVWPERPPAQAANALQALVSRLRRTAPTPIESGPTGYRLAVDPDQIDAHRFARLCAAGRRTLTTAPARTEVVLTEALALWRGEPWPELAASGAATAETARLVELRWSAIEDRADARLSLAGHSPHGGRIPEELIPDLTAVVTAHPTRERAVGLLMRALAATGRTAEALTAYERARRVLADRWGADPAPALAALHRDLLRGTGPPAVPLPTAPPAAPPPPAPPPPAPPPTAPPPARVTVRGNLTAPLSSFVGREEELRRLPALLETHRLITLTGVGGAGKTRLAEETARTVDGQYPDGVWFVPLAPLTDADGLVTTVLAALGLRPQSTLPGAGGRSAGSGAAWPGPGEDPGPEPTAPRDRLVTALGTGRVLLVLDNCEHLIEAAARLADDLLRRCPRLRIVATSREPLGLTGEARWSVEPLGLPPAGADPATAAAAPALRLLLERTGAGHPTIPLDRDQLPALIRICRALDGIPLAIELAAARLRSMPPAQLADRLDDRFRLLTAGNRAALPRHHTLRAMVDWSWDLLDAAERAVWRRFTVFSGGATVAAAEAVCAGPDVPREAVLDLLGRLVDRSLLVLCDAGPTRYRMLETIRAYGAEQLERAGEAEPARTAHVRYFLQLAEAAEPQLRAASQLDWIRRLDADSENLFTAVRTAVAADDAEAAVRLVAALSWYWGLTGQRIAGTNLAAAAFALPGYVPTDVLAVAYAMAGCNAVDGGHDEAHGEEWFRRAVALSPATDRDHPMLRLIGPLSDIFEAWRWGRGESSPPVGLVALFDDPDPWTRGTALAMRAALTLNTGGPPEEAESHYRAALAGFAAAGDRWGQAFVLSGLAEVLARRGDVAAAADQVNRAVELGHQLGVSAELIDTRIRLVQLRWLAGDRVEARRQLAIATREADHAGLPDCRIGARYTAAELARWEGDQATAREILTAARRELTEVSVFPQLTALVTSALGRVEVATGEVAAGLARQLQAYDAALASGDAPVIGRVLIGLADHALATGDPARAAALLAASDAVRGAPDRSLIDVGRLTAEARGRLGETDFAEAATRGRALAGTAADLTALVRSELDRSELALEGPDRQRSEDQDQAQRPGQ